MASGVIEKIGSISEKICEENGAYLYDVEMVKEGKNQILRIYIDTNDGIGIDECEKISRLISEELDKIDLIKGAYNLEVSSPGIERKLKTDKHFEMAYGKEIDITLYAPLNGEKNFMGVLKSVDNKNVVIIINEEEITFERNKISMAKIHFDINEFLKNN